MADDWPVLETSHEYGTDFFDVRSDLVERPDGETARYYYLDRPTDGVAAVAITDDDELLLVEQYRPKIRETVLECPGGALEPGETPEAAAVRELREETGFRADHVEFVETVHLSAFLNLPFHVCVATGLTPGESDRDDGEFIQVRTIPVADAVATVRESVANAWTLAPLLLARDEGFL